MQRLRPVRLPWLSNLGARCRPWVAGLLAHPSVMESSWTSDSNTRRFLTTNSKNRYDDIPKRVYQGAPKRQHGKHAGMRKWSTPKRPVAAEERGADGEMLAFGRSDSTAELRNVSTRLKEIRVSPWSLNLLAKLVRGLDVVDATAQLTFCKKKHTVTVQKAIQEHIVFETSTYRCIDNALNLADMRYGLAAEQMMVGEIFVTKGKVQKRMRIMGRGRAGIARRKWSHLNLTLREIDFDALIDAADSKHRRAKLAARKMHVEALVTARRKEAGLEPSEPLKLDSK